MEYYTNNEGLISPRCYIAKQRLGIIDVYLPCSSECVITHYVGKKYGEVSLSRTDAPAHISNNLICYWVNGMIHRMSAPARITNYSLTWYNNNAVSIHINF